MSSLSLILGAAGRNKTWTPTVQSAPLSAYGVAYGNGRWAMLNPSGYTSYYSTNNGATWTAGGNLYGSRAWSGLWYYDSLFLATEQTSGTISTSPDCVTWTNQGSTQAHGGGAIAYSGSIFVQPVTTAGYTTTTTYETSTNGTSWTSQNFGSYYYMNALVYGSGTFVGMGGNGTNSLCFTSTNGTTWSTSTLSSPVSTFGVNNLAYGNGAFVGVGSGSNYIVSTNAGSTWTEYNMGTGNYISQVIFGGGYFVAINAASTTKYYTSTNGLSWKSHTLSSAFVGAGNGWYGNACWMFPGTSQVLALT